MSSSKGVIIGVDPHKMSATIEVVDTHEQLLGSGRFPTDKAGYAAMRRYVKQRSERTWAVEGANGAGRPLAQRLLENGERVVDVPAKLAARVRLFDTGHNRKTDARDAHSIAVVAVRTKGLRVLAADGELEALRMLTDRRDELARQRVQAVNRLQRLLSELVPGQRKRDLSAAHAKVMLATVRPRDVAGKTRRRMAAEEIVDLLAVDAKLKKIKAELKAAVLARGSSLLDPNGIGPAGAVRILSDVGDVARFANRNRFASWTGTAPLDASSGEQNRHRLSRAGNRRMNHVLHIAAIVQIRHDTEGRAYYRRKLAASKRPRSRHSGASSDARPTSSTANSSPTRRTLARLIARIREGAAGGLNNPARPTYPRESTLRISHFPDPQKRRYADQPTAGSPSPRAPLDTEGSQIRAISRIGRSPATPGRCRSTT